MGIYPKAGRLLDLTGTDQNLYEYVGGNPITRADPTGLSWEIRMGAHGYEATPTAPGDSLWALAKAITGSAAEDNYKALGPYAAALDPKKLTLNKPIDIDSAVSNLLKARKCFTDFMTLWAGAVDNIVATAKPQDQEAAELVYNFRLNMDKWAEWTSKKKLSLERVQAFLDRTSYHGHGAFGVGELLWVTADRFLPKDMATGMPDRTGSAAGRFLGRLEGLPGAGIVRAAGRTVSVLAVGLEAVEGYQAFRAGNTPLAAAHGVSAGVGGVAVVVGGAMIAPGLIAAGLMAYTDYRIDKISDESAEMVCFQAKVLYLGMVRHFPEVYGRALEGEELRSRLEASGIRLPE